MQNGQDGESHVDPNHNADESIRVESDAGRDSADALAANTEQRPEVADINLATVNVGRRGGRAAVVPESPLNITTSGADHHDALIMTRFEKMREKAMRQISLVQDLLSSRNEDMVNGEIQNLDRLLFDLKQVGDTCVSLEADQCVDETEELVFQLKLQVSAWMRELEETRSERSCRSGGSRRSRNSAASSKSRRSNRSLASCASSISVENQAEIAALKAKSERLQGIMQMKLDEEAERAKNAARIRL